MVKTMMNTTTAEAPSSAQAEVDVAGGTGGGPSAADASNDNNKKDYKICDVLGGLDVTRLVSTNTRNFFLGAIDDAELLRQFLVETTQADSGDSSSSEFASLEELSHSLDWKARGVPPNTTTLDLGLGYTDDRKTRRVDRFVGLTNEPLVGTKETDFFMMNGLSTLFPWVVDRQSREDHWWMSHSLGRSEGPHKRPFAFERLYVGAWLISYGDSLLYYPPLTVYDHPLTFGDRVGSNWNSHDAPFSKPNFPENNPQRLAFFSQPYPDTAVPGLSLVSAIAPVYYSGEFRGYTYNDTFVASLGVDIATSSISSFLDVLEDSLAPGSFGMLVDNNMNVIVISEEVVGRVYPPRTGMEESRVTRNPDGTIAVDRRNQTYLPSDTILQDLTKLDNADWSGLKRQIDATAVGVREYTTMDLQLTGTAAPVEYYVMFERWQYVADWTLLVFAPVEAVEQAIDVYLATEDDQARPENATRITLEGTQGTPLDTQDAWIVNTGNLDVKVSTKKVPRWVQLHDDAIIENDKDTAFLLKAGEEMWVGFDVSTDNLNTGTQSSSITFDVQDADYPDCFFRQELSLPISIRVLPMPCPKANSVPNNQGICVCASDSIEIGGNCVQNLTLVMAVVFPILLLVLIGVLLHSWHKRRVADSLWQIDPSELNYGDDSDASEQIIGEGSLGTVVLAEYRGTQVAVKRFQPSSFKTNYNPPTRRGSAVTRLSSTTSVFRGSNGSVASTVEWMESGLTALPEQHPEQAPSKAANTKRRSSILSTMNDVAFSSNDRAEFVKEMRLLSQLRHPNIATVMGAVLADNSSFSSPKTPSTRSIVMEYMENGSLSDCLQNAIELDGEMVLSILHSVTKGLQFLHYFKPKALMHKNLKAANILLDATFKAKLTDFGRHKQGSTLWMAPEVLCGGDANHTPASDVYSFGCVLYEIYARNEPFYGEDPATVTREICDPAINRRPPNPIAMPQGMAALMHDCLVADPEERPSLEEIASRLKRFHADEADPVGLVKKSKGGGDMKDFELLLQVFPRHIAEALRDGRPVEPENHECVSIFFSDIVGFTTISSELPPQKVSDMLHRLFFAMDALADDHELYKVETIGDAYFACTNCVKPQELDHTKRIAEFSLGAMQAANATLIDLDNPSRGHVQIRVGFHVGPVYTNVIGSRNPHYTLFGDTVNTASRMESNSLPGKIQCSEAAANLLRHQAPDIQVTCRGKIPVKGKGEMTTYWIGDPEKRPHVPPPASVTQESTVTMKNAEPTPTSTPGIEYITDIEC